VLNIRDCNLLQSK